MAKNIKESARLKELRNLLTKEIEELERKIELYTLLLNLIDQCSGEVVAKEETQKIEYVDKNENTIAVLYLGKKSIRLLFPRPQLQGNPYIKYILHVIEQLADESDKITYNIVGDENTLNSIAVNGISEDEIEELQSAIEYAMRKLGAKPRS